MRKAAVSVPASAANVGPGYDSFALALDLRNHFSAEEADDWSVTVGGEGADSLPADESNPVVRAMRRLFAEAGVTGKAARVATENRIPVGRGLGSSAAAVVGGLMLADALCDSRLGNERLFELAVELEGHADNAAAALFGGFTISWLEGAPRCTSLLPAGGLAAVLVVGRHPLPTGESRSVLPAQVPHGDAAFGAGRAGLLVSGLILGREDLLAAGLADRLHEPYREEALVPDLPAVRSALLGAGSVGATLSGSGPTVVGLVFGTDDDDAFDRAEDVAARAARSLEGVSNRPAPVAVRIDRRGALVEL